MLLDIQGDINAIKNTMNELKKLSDEEKINLPKDVYLRNIFCCDCSLKKTCGNYPCENYEFWKKGYEQGYEDCRHYAHDYYKPKWHDLRKDPDDLPKEIEIYSVPVYVVSKQGNSDLAQYDHRRKLWNYKHTDEHILYDVIAWAELPKFEE